MFKRLIVPIFAIFLTACSQTLGVKSLPPQPTESRLFAVEQLEPKQEKSVLVVQFQPEMWRWVQTDPLGSPIARLQLSQAGWQNDGFVPPNPQAKWLFSALASAFNRQQPLFEVSRIEPLASGERYFQQHKWLWDIRQQHQQTWITLNDQSQWRITELQP